MIEKDITLSFYKKKGYYKLKGDKEIEFCVDKFEDVVDCKKGVKLKISKKEKRGYTKIDLKKCDRFISCWAEINKTKFLLWGYCWKKIVEKFGPKIYFKVLK